MPVFGSAVVQHMIISVPDYEQQTFMLFEQSFREQGWCVGSIYEGSSEYTSKMWPANSEALNQRLRTARADWERSVVSALRPRMVPKTQEGLFAQVHPLLFVALIEPIPTEKPTSELAKIWNGCLGPSAIPFDPMARQALIDKGSAHPGLKSHIDAWRKMKATGSKWATGDFGPSECGVVQ
jgi:hypothetical protein